MSTSWGPTPKIFHNSNLDGIQGLFQGYYQNMGNPFFAERKTNKMIKGLTQNPASSPYFDIYKYKAAAAKRDAVRNQDPYLPAGLSQSRLQHTNDTIDQEAMGQAGMSYQQFLMGLLGQSGQMEATREGLQLGALRGQSDAAQGSDHFYMQPGLGSTLMPLLGSAVGAFNPFSRLGGLGGGGAPAGGGASPGFPQYNA
jgi:hypothetical protein